MGTSDIYARLLISHTPVEAPQKKSTRGPDMHTDPSRREFPSPLHSTLNFTFNSQSVLLYCKSDINVGSSKNLVSGADW